MFFLSVKVVVLYNCNTVPPALTDKTKNSLQVSFSAWWCLQDTSCRLWSSCSFSWLSWIYRSYSCKHAQCFDLEVFIGINQSVPKRKWTCPICNVPVKTSAQLYVDRLDVVLILPWNIADVECRYSRAFGFVCKKNPWTLTFTRQDLQVLKWHIYNTNYLNMGFLMQSLGEVWSAEVNHYSLFSFLFAVQFPL